MIERVGIRILRAAVTDGVAMSFAAMPQRSGAILSVTAAGKTGYGESWINYPAWAADERLATILHGVAPLLLGADERDISACQAELVAKLGPLGRQWGAPGPIMQAISGADIALWDLAGNMPPPVRDRIPVYASSLGPTGVAGQARRALADGYDLVKIKVGFGAATDQENLAIARDILGDTGIFVDANQAWTLAEAIEMAPILSRYGVELAEEPIAGDRIEDLEEFHRRTGIRVLTGENLYGRAAFEAYVRSPAIAAVQPDVTKTGGITEILAICELAAAAGKPVWPHFYGGASGWIATMRLAAMAPGIERLEYDVRSNPLRDPLLVDRPAPVSGEIRLQPTDLDQAAVAAVCEQFEEVAA